MKTNEKNTTVTLTGKVVGETEKAYKVVLEWTHLETYPRRHEWNTWVPKSQVIIEADGKITAAKWLADKIGNEIRKFSGMCSNVNNAGKSILYEML
jgi:hypothetical protein